MVYLVIINLISLILFALDKFLAKKHKRRIPEKTLFLISLAGGSIGSLIGMYLFRHKTKHRSFRVGIPMILILQIFIYCIIWI